MGFPSGPSIAITCWRCKRPGHDGRFSNFGQAFGPAGSSQTPISEFRADVSLNSSNCVNVLEELYHEDLFVFDKMLNSK